MAGNFSRLASVASLVSLLAACGGGGGGGDGAIVDRVAPLTSSDGAGGFLWKPSGDHSSKLVVLLPSEFNSRATAVEVHRESPPTVESFVEGGVFSGIANGNRSHWRFSQPGAAYGQNIFVITFTNDGEVYSSPIPDGARRVD